MPLSRLPMAFLAAVAAAGGEHPLIEAAARGDVSAAERELRDDPGAETRILALQRAAVAGSVRIVEVLARNGVPVDSVTGSSPTTALLLTIDQVRERDESVAALLNLGASPNARTREGRTALMLAARWGHARILDRLIAAKADVNATNAAGLTALIVAETWHPELVPPLRAAGARGGRESLPGNLADLIRDLQSPRPAAARAAAEAFERLGRQAAPAVPYLTVLPMLGRGRAVLPHIWPFARDLTSDLLDAAATGNTELWHELNLLHMQRHRSANRRTEPRDANGRTALMLALMNGHDRTARYIMDVRGFPYHRDLEGRTAIQLAAANGQIRAVEAFLAGLPQTHLSLASASAGQTITYCILAGAPDSHHFASVITNPPVAATFLVGERPFDLASGGRSLVDIGPLRQPVSVISVKPAAASKVAVSLYAVRGEIEEANAWRNSMALTRRLPACAPFGALSPAPNAAGAARALYALGVGVLVVVALALTVAILLYLRRFVRYRRRRKITYVRMA